jgi:murein L,D-transpeptidase YcbB/YkuD
MKPLFLCTAAWLIAMHPIRVAVNLPAFRLDVFAGDSVVRSMPVAIGMRGFRTPRGEFDITSVEWNPWWIPPNSAWARKEKPTPPGRGNPMGRVKLNFQPLYFLHGTPLEQSIGSAASHGCIRMKNADAVELARLVERFGAPMFAGDDIERIAADTVTTRIVLLEAPVPIEIRYDLVEVRDRRVFVYRDVYNLAVRPLRAELYTTLAGHGLDTMRLDESAVRRFLRRIAPAGSSILTDSLLKPED